MPRHEQRKGKKVAQISQSALTFRSRVEDEQFFLSTCDGGDPGTPDRQSVWLLGIEPGWSVADAEADQCEDAEHEAKLSAYSVELQLEWPFNRNAFKLLSALEGGVPEDSGISACEHVHSSAGQRDISRAIYSLSLATTSASGMLALP